MSKDQRKVAVGAVAAAIFSTAFFEVMFHATAINLTPPGGFEMSWRLGYVIRWEVFAALCLLAGVGKIGNMRFFRPDAIAGGPAPLIATAP